jgi:hypothetical protein
MPTCLTTGDEHQTERSEGWWRRRESNPRPKVFSRGTLHACPFLFSHARRGETANNRQAPDPVKSRDRTPGRRSITSLFNGIWPPTTRPGQGRRSQLIRLRERTDYPQLTDVPSDLRVNGARHASRESLPPSKPFRPLGVRTAPAREPRSSDSWHCTPAAPTDQARGGGSPLGRRWHVSSTAGFGAAARCRPPGDGAFSALATEPAAFARPTSVIAASGSRSGGPSVCATGCTGCTCSISSLDLPAPAPA